MDTIYTNEMQTTSQQTALQEQESDQPRVVDLSGISTVMERENLSKFQRVAAGFFAQTKEPALTINGRVVGVTRQQSGCFQMWIIWRSLLVLRNGRWPSSPVMSLIFPDINGRRQKMASVMPPREQENLLFCASVR